MKKLFLNLEVIDGYPPVSMESIWAEETEEGESRQQTHYFHCDQIGIPREMIDKDGNLVWLRDYYGFTSQRPGGLWITILLNI